MNRMKKKLFLITGMMLLVLASFGVQAQKFDQDRMNRDIEVSENVLSTLIKQQFNNQRTFFPLEIRGSYQSGYGVTFNLPADFTTPIAFAMPQGNVIIMDNGADVRTVSPAQVQGFRYEYSESDKEEKDAARTNSLRGRAAEKKRNDMDSMRNAYSNKVIEAAKTFLVDYGDLISQLGANEKIVISNQGNQPRMWVNQYFEAPKRTHLSIEITKADLASMKQGKISRDQALAKVKVVNTQTINEVAPDLELLASMFNRLYRQDLSKTYFTENNIYYERMKDFGAIFYMTVYSGVEVAPRRFRMPTAGLDDVDMETRNKKVKELYPKFEQELKEHILEYGRTVKSLKDDEVLVFQVKMTKCVDCGIPSTLEYTVKGNVLKDFNSGKLEKNSALSKISLKKGSNQ
jgi:hypothetical protein